jgi:hypothetical protein
MRRSAFVAGLALIFAAPSFAQSVTRVLVFGDSNSWGWTPERAGFPTVRLPDGQRWPDVMAARLGDAVSVKVDALSGRTVDVDYAQPIGSVPGDQFNGARSLPSAIAFGSMYFSPNM